MKGYLGEAHDFDLAFGKWMLVGVPWALVMFALAWLILTKLVFRAEVEQIPGGAEMIRSELAALGPMRTAERRVAIIFLTAIFFWIAVPFIVDIPAVAEAGMDPLLMSIAVTLAVCSAYMLPVATPSNAVAFGSGAVSIKQMVRAGVWLNLASPAILMVALYTIVPLVFGVGL